MTDRKWTPAPWYADNFGNITTHKPHTGLRALLPTTGIVAKCQKYRCVEDARLMAAAPEMYDVLTSIENDAGQVPDWLWDKIRSVLRKANGKQP